MQTRLWDAFMNQLNALSNRVEYYEHEHTSMTQLYLLDRLFDSHLLDWDC